MPTALLLVLALAVSGVASPPSAITPPPNPPGDAPPKKPPRETIAIGGETFKLELAVDAAQRQKGLMGRRSLDRHGGMIFVFPDLRMRSFWMYDCLIDIDLLYLDEKGTVLAMHRMRAEAPRGKGESVWDYETRLRRYTSRRPARFAIELQTGSIDRLGLEIGQRLKLDGARLRSLAR
ncbi:MAG: DUF192 domain-containing protein [Planctomycetota bacterium]|jgi:uncharacterized membrane protein (UPF0127 family)